MKNFEYKSAKVSSWWEFDESLRLEGSDGWELVCFRIYITDTIAYFKREIREKPVTARICYEDGMVLEK